MTLSKIVSGFEMYDGPVRVESNRFKNFLPDSRHNGSAIGNLQANNYQTAPTNYAKASTFLDASRRLNHGIANYLVEHDGDRNPVVLDLDGTISGIANSFIVADNPFFKSKNCTSKPDWDAAVCWAQKYGQLFFRNDDAARTNFSGITTGQVFYMTRDEYSAYPLGFEGIPGGKNAPIFTWFCSNPCCSNSSRSIPTASNAIEGLYCQVCLSDSSKAFLPVSELERWRLDPRW